MALLVEMGKNLVTILALFLHSGSVLGKSWVLVRFVLAVFGFFYISYC